MLAHGLQLLRLFTSVPLQFIVGTRVAYQGRTLSNKLCIITGGSSGIGLATANEMVRRGCDVILLVRDRQKTAPIIADIRKINDMYLGSRPAEVTVLECELSSLVSVRMCVLELKKLVKRRTVDYLCCTAGVFMQPPGPPGQDKHSGLEGHYAVNYLGHYALIGGLLGLLRASRSRVVVLASDLMVLQNDVFPRSDTDSGDTNLMMPGGGGLGQAGHGHPVAPDNIPEAGGVAAVLLRSLRGLRDFCRSKLASAAFGYELHVRYPELAIYTVHSGVLNSHMHALPAPGVVGAIYSMLKEVFLISNKLACQSVLLCLLSDRVPAGSYYHNVYGALPWSGWFMPACLCSAVWRRNVWDEADRLCYLQDTVLEW